MNKLFNWKKYPGSVFWFAIPLVTLGLGATFIQAYIMWSAFSDPWFMVIWLVGIIIGAIALYPAYKTLVRNEKRNDD